MPGNGEVKLSKAMPNELLSTQRKVVAAKGLVTRSIKKLETSFNELLLLREDAPELTRQRLASEIQESRKKAEKHLAQMEGTGEVLMRLIAEMDPAEATEDPETTISKVNDDISIYMDKFEVFKIDNAKTLEKVDDLMKPKESSKAKTNSPDGSTTTEFGRFTAVADLKPVYLDKLCKDGLP